MKLKPFLDIGLVSLLDMVVPIVVPQFGAHDNQRRVFISNSLRRKKITTKASIPIIYIYI